MLLELKNDLYSAMKTKDNDIKSVIQMVLSAVSNEKIKLKRDLTDSEIVEVIKKEIKQIDEALEYCDTREVMKTSLLNKKSYLMKYVPAQMSSQQIADFVTEVIEQYSEDCKNIGSAMKTILPKLAGKADKSIIAEEVRKHF